MRAKKGSDEYSYAERGLGRCGRGNNAAIASSTALLMMAAVAKSPPAEFNRNTARDKSRSPII